MTKKVDLALPQLGFVIVTRALLGAGIGLLVGSRLTRSQMRRLGLGLLSVGVLTTIPAAFMLKGAWHRADEAAAGPVAA